MLNKGQLHSSLCPAVFLPLLLLGFSLSPLPPHLPPHSRISGFGRGGSRTQEHLFPAALRPASPEDTQLNVGFHPAFPFTRTLAPHKYGALFKSPQRRRSWSRERFRWLTSERGELGEKGPELVRATNQEVEAELDLLETVNVLCCCYLCGRRE